MGAVVLGAAGWLLVIVPVRSTVIARGGGLVGGRNADSAGAREPIGVGEALSGLR